MREINFLIILIIFSSIALSADDFEGYKYSGDKFTLGDDEFLIRLSNDESTLSFKSDLELVNVKKGGCESTQHYKYCFNDTIIDFDKDLGKLHDYTGEMMPAIKIIMTSLKADLDVARTLSSSTPNEYEPVQVTIILENKGKKAAKIGYSENISEPAEAYNCQSCTELNNQILYIATLYPGNPKTFSYYVNPKDTEKLLLSPILTYETDISNGTVAIKTLTIQPKKTFIVTYSGNKEPVIENVEKGTISFKNNDPKDKISFTSALMYDEDIIFSSTQSNVKKENNNLVFSGTLDPLQTKEFSVNVLGKISGEKKLTIKNDYSLGSDKIKSNSTFDLKVVIQKPVFEMLLDTAIYSDILEEIEFNIDNSGSKNSFKNIMIDIDVPDAVDENFMIPFIRYSRDLNAYKKKYYLISDIKKTVDAKIKIDYITMYDEELTSEITKKITLNPISEIVSIEHNIEDYKQKEGDMTVSTFVKNNDDTMIVLNVSETIESAEVLTLDERRISDYTKITKADYFYVNPLSKKQAFSYLLRKQSNNTASMESKVIIKGAANIYEITFDSLIDFEKKTITLKNTAAKRLLHLENTELNQTGIQAENIELEKTHTYQTIEEPTIEDGAKEPNNTFDVSTKVSGEEQQVQENNDAGKKSFFTKVWDVIRSFF